jgi:hypothetical protein
VSTGQRWLNRWDFSLAVAVALVAMASSLGGIRAIGPDVLDRAADEAWFGSDARRVHAAMSDRHAVHRPQVHPVFSLIAVGPVYILRHFSRLSPYRATATLVAGIAGLWAAALYALLRALGCRRTDAIAFTLLGITTAAGVFWLPLRETYALGSLGVLAALSLMADSPRWRSPTWLWIVASAATLAVTVTNWMFGLLGAALLLPIRRALRVTLGAFMLVVGLWSVQRALVPAARFFIAGAEERGYMYRPSWTRFAQVLTTLTIHSIVAPRVLRLAEGGHPRGIDNGLRLPQANQLTVQTAAIGSGGMWGAGATVAWLAMLGLGVRAAMRRSRSERIWLVLLLGLTGQLALHTIYGSETFLYSLHWTPLLVAVAAAATLTPARPVVMTLAVIVMVAGGANNAAQFRRVARLYGAERLQAQRAIRERPQDPWPRGAGHVVLAIPGTLELLKSYHEPGGSFSPANGTFGVSIWVTDPGGHLTTSDDLSLSSIRQHFDWGAPRRMPPDLVTDTPYYEARWVTDGPSAWRLLIAPLAPAARIQLVIRSVGPSGGPVRALEWSGGRLRVNARWSLRPSPMPTLVTLGHEGEPHWKDRWAAAPRWEGEDGWGYARLALAPDRPTTVALSSDSLVTPPTGVPLVAGPSLSLPDPRFAESLRAGVTHLAMSLVRAETRSVDPINTPIPWQRTGAYIITALARAGQVTLATDLSRFLAVNDYYGGFGAEADAPGLGIWTLSEVAAQAADPDYDRWVWPHVQRKAERILNLLAARAEVVESIGQPTLPWADRIDNPTLVAEAARNGLIVGRMDQRRPLLYVNAVSYLGLAQAAGVAARLGHDAEARRYQQHALDLRAAWMASLRPPEVSEERALTAALWPSGVVDRAARSTLRTALLNEWAYERDSTGGFRRRPLRPYFELAKAHQWLLLGESRRSWATLDWLWRNQASPGLYTWSEGNGEWNTAGWWAYTRGWLAPVAVTPSYWTTAEMLLLQLDMLAYVDPTAGQLVVGAGIPAEWLRAPLAVSGLRLGDRTVDWSWSAGQLTVIIHGPPIAVRPGDVFPRTARLVVH